MAPNNPTINSFAEFWPYYVRQHGHRVNRLLHAIGTTLGTLILGAALVAGEPVLLFLVPIVGYGLSWIGHFLWSATCRRPSGIRSGPCAATSRCFA